MGTTVSCRLIHIWWATEYLWQQDGVCGIAKKKKKTKKKLQCPYSWQSRNMSLVFLTATATTEVYGNKKNMSGFEYTRNICY